MPTAFSSSGGNGVARYKTPAHRSSTQETHIDFPSSGNINELPRSPFSSLRHNIISQGLTMAPDADNHGDDEDPADAALLDPPRKAGRTYISRRTPCAHCVVRMVKWKPQSDAEVTIPVCEDDNS